MRWKPTGSSWATGKDKERPGRRPAGGSKMQTKRIPIHSILEDHEQVEEAAGLLRQLPCGADSPRQLHSSSLRATGLFLFLCAFLTFLRVAAVGCKRKREKGGRAAAAVAGQGRQITSAAPLRQARRNGRRPRQGGCSAISMRAAAPPGARRRPARSQGGAPGPNRTRCQERPAPLRAVTES